MKTKKIHSDFIAFYKRDGTDAFLNISDRGKGKDGNALWYIDNLSADKTFVVLIKEVSNYQYAIVEDVDGKFLVSTSYGAKNRKLVLIDPMIPGLQTEKL